MKEGLGGGKLALSGIAGYQIIAKSFQQEINVMGIRGYFG